MKQGYKFDYIIKDLDQGQRIDKFLVGHLEESRSSIQREIQSGHILVNSKQIKPNYTLRSNDRVRGDIPHEEALHILPENIPLDVIYEDDHMLLINKQPGLVVHPGTDHSSGTLVNGLLYHYQGKLSTCAGPIRPGIVHRLDKDTSGLLIIAKNNQAHEKLSKMLSDYEITRRYHAIVFGNFNQEEGVIDAPIGRDPVNRTTMTVIEENSRPAQTSYKVLQQFQGFAYVELTLHTGRTHQLRVHMKHIGHPILGDLTYGPKRQAFSKTGQLLHAKILGFNHPITKEYMEFNCPLPLYFQTALKNLPK